MKHAPMIAGFKYRGSLVCRACVRPEEHNMTGYFYDWNEIEGSGWTCERCGVELEYQPATTEPDSGEER
jgi:hypothetical protein